MIGFALRAVATVFLAVASVSAVLDVTRSIGAAAFVATPLGTSWQAALPGLLAGARESLAGSVAAFTLPAFEALLTVPTWAVLGGLAILLYWIGRPRPSIGSRFARE